MPAAPRHGVRGSGRGLLPAPAVQPCRPCDQWPPAPSPPPHPSLAPAAAARALS